MKKIFSTLVIMVCLLLAVPAQAQVKDNTTGFFVGPMVDVTLPIIGLGIDVAALYSQSGLDVNNENSEKLKSIEIPVNLKWTLGLGSTLGVYVAAGPQFGFSINDGWSQCQCRSRFKIASSSSGWS